MAGNAGGVYTEVGVDTQKAEAAFARLEKLAETLAQKMESGSKRQKKAQQDLGNSVDTTKKSYQDYFKEQRFDDRLRGQRLQSISGLAMAFSFLSQGQEGASSTMNKLSKSMVAGVAASEATEFAFKDLSVAGERMGGKLGKVLVGLGKYAGPVAMVASAVAGLVTWMNEANEESKRMEEAGVSKMIQGLVAAAGGSTKLLEAAIDNLQRDFVNANKMAAIAKSGGMAAPAPSGGVGIPGVTGPNLAPISDQDRLKRLQAEQDRTNAQARGADVTHKQAVEAINESLANQNNEYAAVVEKIRKAITETEVMAKWEAKINEIVKERGSEFMKQQVRLGEIQKALQFTDMSDKDRRKLLDEQYAIQAKMAGQNKTSLALQNDRIARMAFEVEQHRQGTQALREQLEIARKLAKTPEEQLAIDKQIYAIDKQTTEQRKKFIEEIRQLQLMGIDDQYQAAISAENARYQTEIEHIRETGIERKDAVTGEMILTKEARQALQENELAHERVLRQLRDDNERQITQQRMGALDQYAGQLMAIGQRWGSDLTQNLAKGLQLAIGIAKAISAAQAPGADSFAGGLGVFSSILGIFSMFDSGGYTGKGGPKQPAGIVHKNEIVFESPLVNRYGPQLLEMRRSLQRGYAGGGLVGGGMAGMGMGAPAEIVGRLDIDKGEVWLRRKQAGVTAFERRKRLTA